MMGNVSVSHRAISHIITLTKLVRKPLLPMAWLTTFKDTKYLLGLFVSNNDVWERGVCLTSSDLRYPLSSLEHFEGKVCTARMFAPQKCQNRHRCQVYMSLCITKWSSIHVVMYHKNH